MSPAINQIKSKVLYADEHYLLRWWLISLSVANNLIRNNQAGYIVTDAMTSAAAAAGLLLLAYYYSCYVRCLPDDFFSSYSRWEIVGIFTAGLTEKMHFLAPSRHHQTISLTLDKMKTKQKEHKFTFLYVSVQSSTLPWILDRTATTDRRSLSEQPPAHRASVLHRNMRHTEYTYNANTIKCM